MNKLSLIFLLILTLFSLKSFAQSDAGETIKSMENLTKLANSVYGTDDELVNGEVYYREHLYAAGHPFFISDEWLEGSVMVNGTNHQNLQLKYNIVSSQLILKAILNNGGSVSILLNNDFIDLFFVDGHEFVRADSLLKLAAGTEMIELVYNGSFSFYAAYQKSFLRDYKIDTPHGKYSDLVGKYFLVKDGAITKITSKKSVLDYFEPSKKEIKKYIKKNKFKFKKAGKAQWLALLGFCDSLGSNQSQQ